MYTFAGSNYVDVFVSKYKQLRNQFFRFFVIVNERQKYKINKLIILVIEIAKM